MPQLDRFLAALVSHRASALMLGSDVPAQLDMHGTPRAITKTAFNEAQLLALLQELAPGNARMALESGAATTFAYKLGGWRIRRARDAARRAGCARWCACRAAARRRRARRCSTRRWLRRRNAAQARGAARIDTGRACSEPHAEVGAAGESPERDAHRGACCA